MTVIASADVDIGASWRGSMVSAELSLGAGLVHLGVAGDHLAQVPVEGVFFVGTALLQWWWAFMAMRYPHRGVFWVGVLMNAALITTWLVSRTVGLPFGPEAFEAQRWDLVGAAAVLMELGLVAIALAAARPAKFDWIARRLPSPELALPIVLGAAVVTFFLPHTH